LRIQISYVCSIIMYLGTYKIPKVKLQSEGYDLNVVKDTVYFLLNGSTYVTLTPELLKEITTGAIKF